MKTHLTIEHIGAHTGFFNAKHERAMWTVFAFASIGGLLFGILLTDRSLLSRITESPRSLLGAVGSTETSLPNEMNIGGVATVTPEVLGIETTVPSPEDIAMIAEAQRVAEEKAIAYDASLREISNTINQDELSLIRLNQEMKLVKDASVALIADFDRNCGSWKDTCGSKYASDLEAYNVRYDELLKEQNEVELHKNTALESRNSLTSAG